MNSRKLILSTLLAAAMMGSAIGGAAIAAPRHEMPREAQEMGGADDFGPGEGMRGMPCGGMALSPEQQQKYEAILDEYSKKMEPVKDQLFIKRQELRALQNAADPDIPAVRTAASELLQLRKQLGQMHEEMRQRLQKEVGKPDVPARPNNAAPGKSK